MVDEIEKRKAKYKFSQIAEKLNGLAGEDGSFFCAISSEYVNALGVSGKVERLCTLATCLIEAIAENSEYDASEIALGIFEYLQEKESGES